MINLSIITVLFNPIKSGRKEMLLQAVNSIANQQYDSYEHIIIDGASTDGTVELLNELKSQGKITFFVSEPDKGIYDAMNKGVKYAKGKYIGFLNSDDYYCDTQAFKKIVYSIKNYDFCYAPTILLEENTDRNLGISKPNLKRFLTKIPFCHQSFFMNRNHFNQLKGFDTDFMILADYDLMVRYLLSNIKPRGVKLGEPFVCFRLGGMSSQVEKFLEEKTKHWQKNHCDIDYKSEKILPIKILINILYKSPHVYYSVFIEIIRTIRKKIFRRNL